MNTRDKVQLYRRLLRKAESDLRQADLQKREAGIYSAVQKAPPETAYQYLLSLHGQKNAQYVLFFDADRRFLGWADSMARGLDIPPDAEVADTTHELALVPGRWTE